MVAPTGVEPVSIASYPLLLLQPPFGVCGLDFLITVAQMRVRLHPSSLYTFQARPKDALGLARDCHAQIRIDSATLSAGFPEFECFSPVVSRLMTQFFRRRSFYPLNYGATGE